MSEDLLLVKRAQKGDMSALEKIVISYEKQIYLYCLRMTNDSAEAEDLVQEVFIKMYRSITRFKGESKLSTWLYRIAYHAAVDHFRKKRRLMPAIAHHDLKELEDPTQPEQQVIQNENLETVRRCIIRLKPDYRTAIILRDIKHYAYQEISEAMKLPVGTVKSHVSRARRQLRTMLADEGIREYEQSEVNCQ